MIAKDKAYQNLFDVTNMIDDSVKNSHDVVSYWMVFMNTHIGSKMKEDKIGIYRSVNYINPNLFKNHNFDLDGDTIRVIQNWNNIIGQYVAYQDGMKLDHELLKTDSYVHISSPIRRLVDLLNQMLLFQKTSLVRNISSDATDFLKKWVENDGLEYLNASMRSIRKIQTDCALLDRCFNNPDVMNEIYSGVIFDKIIRNDGSVSYMVYLRELKLLSRISSSSIHFENFTLSKFKIYLFEDEDKTKKKIRLHCIV
jgi:hypothetical protein